MRLRSRIATVIGAVAVATMLTVTNASAVTIEEDVASGTTSPGPTTICTPSGSWSQACFYADGDWFGVRDTWEDELSGVIDWRVENPTTHQVVRAGHVWNHSGSDAGWRWKNKDFPEDYILYFKSCRGSYSRLHIQDGSCSVSHAAWI